MANPTQGDVHVNKPLTNISVAWIQSQDNYISTKIFPLVPVSNQSDLYYEFDRGDFLRDEAQLRGESSESAGSGFKLSTTPYSCKVEAFHKDIDDKTRANADGALTFDRAATAFVSQKMAIRRERRFATTYFTTGVWGTDITPGTLWSAAASTPRADVDTGKATVLAATGFEPNTLLVSYAVFLKLRSNPDVRDQFKYVSADSIDEAMLARYFGVKNFYVARAVYNSALEGAAATGVAMFGKHALLCYIPDAASILSPAAGYTFAWTGYTGSVDGIRIKKFRMENLASDRIEGEMAYDFKVVGSSLGYFFNGCIA